jgi:alcohol dehydrogenase
VLDAISTERPYTESRPLSVVELELDGPGDGELLIRVDAAGLCHSDLSVIDGNRVRPLPMALGHEAAGTVLDVGRGVADVAAGDRVVLVFVPSCGTCGHCSAGQPVLCAPAAAANGAGSLLRGGRRLRRDGAEVNHHLGVSAFSELAVVDRASVVVIDDDVPSDIAALFGCAVLTGAGAVLNTAQVRPGDSVGVFGLGGVGLAAVMGAALAGANPVVAIDPVPAKRELALQVGATAALDPTGAEELSELAPGGLRYAFEAVGRSEVLAAAFAATGRGGTTVSMGLPHPAATVSLPALAIVAEARTLVGSYMGSAAPQRDIPRLIELWRAGRLPVERLRSGTLGLDDVNAGMEALADGSAVRQLLLPGG